MSKINLSTRRKKDKFEVKGQNENGHPFKKFFLFSSRVQTKFVRSDLKFDLSQGKQFVASDNELSKY